MNLVDSSGWLEYFAGGPLAGKFSAPLNNTASLIVPTICLYEVFKVVLREKNEDAAFQAIALMNQGNIVELSTDIAVHAAKISHAKKIPMADSIILATAMIHEAIVWTKDDDFKGLQGVKYFPPKSKEV
jgi:predicted nucleic acid-binding protein